MSFHTNVKQMIECYGSPVTIQRGDEIVKTKAFIQPLRYKTGFYNDKAVSLGGFSDGRYYLYIGQADNVFCRTDIFKNFRFICIFWKNLAHIHFAVF